MTTATVDKVTLDDDRVQILRAFIKPLDVRDIPRATGLPIELVRAVIASDAGGDRVYAGHLVEQFELQTSPATARSEPDQPDTATASPSGDDAITGDDAQEPEPQHAAETAHDAGPDPELEFDGTVGPDGDGITDAGDDEGTEDAEARPRIVVLCGPARFRDAVAAAYRELTLAGAMVLATAVFGPADDELGPQVEAELHTLQLHMVDLADEVVVIAPGGDVDEPTRKAIVYAQVLGTPVSYRKDEVTPSLLRTGGSYLCRRCDSTATSAGQCCDQPMIPVRVELHRSAA